MSKPLRPQLSLFPVAPYVQHQLTLFPLEAFSRSRFRPRLADSGKYFVSQSKGKEVSHV